MTEEILRVVYLEGTKVRSLTGIVADKWKEWIKVKQPKGDKWTAINTNYIIKITNNVKEDGKEKIPRKE